MNEIRHERSEFVLGWRPLAAALLGTACGASPLPFNVIPLVMGPMNAEFGWSFGQISIGVTIFGVLGALLAPVYGAMSDRYGVRPVALISLIAFALVFASFYFMPPSLAGYYAFCVVLGLIVIGSTPVTWSRAVSLWFAKNRGLALGITLLGTSLAGLVVPQIAQRAIAFGGWRFAFPAMALLPLLIAFPVALAWFREPRPEEGPPSVVDASGRVLGFSLAEGMRSYRFWVLFVSILLAALAYGGAHIHMAQMVQLHGFTAADAPSVMGVVAIGILSGRIIVGLLFDRFWAPGIAFPVLLLPAAACWILMGTGGSLGLMMTGGFLLGFAAGAESDVVAFLASKYFGMAHFGKIYGMLYLAFGVGSAVSPVLYGAVRDATGSYDRMLLAAILMFAISGALLLALGRYPDFSRAGEDRQAAL